MPPTIGKLQAERELRQPRKDTNCRHSNTARSRSTATSCLQPATAGSLGLDLAAAIKVTLMTTRPTKIPTGVFGPIQIQGINYGGLILGRSSTTLLGLTVLTGVIDADYTGEIQIMAYTLYPPLAIEAGQRIAQFIPLPQITTGLMPKQKELRGERGFGSSGVAMLTLDLSTRPKTKVTITYVKKSVDLWGLLDTGADTSIVSPENWPSDWPIKHTTDTVTGVGGFTLAKKTPLVSVTIDGQTLVTVLTVVPLPPTVQLLIGRDILSQLGVVLSNQHPLG